MPALVEPRRWSLPDETLSNGCFETMRAYHGRIFRLEDHLDRLYASAKDLGTQAPRDRGRFRRHLIEALARSGLREAVVRVALIPQASSGAHPNIVVQPVLPPSPAAYRRGIRLVVVPARSCTIAAINPQAKYSARLGSVLALVDAHLRGAEEALFLDARGYVTESTASNFAIVRHGTICASPCSLGLLWGITRDVLYEVAHAMRLSIRDTPLTRHDLYIADEAFLSSTIKEVLPVTEIDGRRIGTGRPGPITTRLHRAFRQLVRRELKLR